MNSSISSSKRFVIYLLSVSGIVLITLLGGMEYFLRQQQLINAENDDYKSRFVNGKAPWVALGDSHSANALVSTTWLDNLGQASDNLGSIEGKIDIILMGRANLKGVILPADPQVFSYYRLTADQAERVTNLRNVENNTRLLIFRPEYRPYLSRLAWSLITNPIRRINQSNTPPNQLKKVAKNSALWRRDVALRAQLHTPITNLLEHNAATRYRALVERIMRKNIKVCLVAYPVSELYREMTAEPAGFRAARRFFKALAADTGARLVDQSDAFPENAFNDPDHLLASEAPAFTNVLHQACGVEPIESQ